MAYFVLFICPHLIFIFHVERIRTFYCQKMTIKVDFLEITVLCERFSSIYKIQTKYIYIVVHLPLPPISLAINDPVGWQTVPLYNSIFIKNLYMLLLYSYNLCFKLLVPLISIPSLIKLSIYSSYYTVFRRKVYLNKQMKQLFWLYILIKTLIYSCMLWRDRSAFLNIQIPQQWRTWATCVVLV